jgi:hypothetical protein
MSTKRKPIVRSAPKPPARTKPDEKPIVVTISGPLASRIRHGAKTMGMRASTVARMCATFGNLMTDNTEEAKEYRRDSALSYLASAGR